MKVEYKDFCIEVTREKCLAGYSMLYYDVFQKDTLWELTSGFLDSEDTVMELVKDMKKKVDDYLENPQDYED